MVSPAANANGHRRRELRARVLAEEHTCALCGLPVDKRLPVLDPGSAVVDEDIPRSRGGSPLQRDNCHLMHRACNRWKSALTLTEARAKLAKDASSVPRDRQIVASDVW